MSVRRLYIVCEGQTEESFVNLVLRSHFQDVTGTDAIPLLLPNKRGSKSRRHKGGWNRYALLRDVLVRLFRTSGAGGAGYRIGGDASFFTRPAFWLGEHRSRPGRTWSA